MRTRSRGPGLSNHHFIRASFLVICGGGGVRADRARSIKRSLIWKSELVLDIIPKVGAVR
jgi:hypothetical protein